VAAGGLHRRGAIGSGAGCCGPCGRGWVRAERRTDIATAGSSLRRRERWPPRRFRVRGRGADRLCLFRLSPRAPARGACQCGAAGKQLSRAGLAERHGGADHKSFQINRTPSVSITVRELPGRAVALRLQCACGFRFRRDRQRAANPDRHVTIRMVDTVCLAGLRHVSQTHISAETAGKGPGSSSGPSVPPAMPQAGSDGQRRQLLQQPALVPGVSIGLRQIGRCASGCICGGRQPGQSMYPASRRPERGSQDATTI